MMASATLDVGGVDGVDARGGLGEGHAAAVGEELADLPQVGEVPSICSNWNFSCALPRATSSSEPS